MAWRWRAGVMSARRKALVAGQAREGAPVP